MPAVIGAVALFLLLMGLKVHHDYAALAACHGAGAVACENRASQLTSTDWTMANTILILMNLAPALIGGFAGAPVLARELETGTFRYAWTQGFGRIRSTLARIVLIAIVLAAVSGALGELLAWLVVRKLDRPELGPGRVAILQRLPATPHFWPAQLIEAGWLLALSALLFVATLWLVRHRVA